MGNDNNIKYLKNTKYIYFLPVCFSDNSAKNGLN